MSSENPHAGQGPVVVDIGGDIGALVVVMPDAMVDLEVEIVPTGTAHQHGHTHDHSHEHGHQHDHEHDHQPHPPHVAVVPRPVPSGATIASLVFGELPAGAYDLYVRPDGPVELTVEVVGGEVTQDRWPGT